MGSQPKSHWDEAGNLIYEANDIDPLCDFCCMPEVDCVAALLVATVQLPDTVEIAGDGSRRGRLWSRTSIGEWYVCRDCLTLILTHDRDGLAERALRLHLRKERFPRNSREMRDLQRLEGEVRKEILIVHAGALDQLEDWVSTISLDSPPSSQR